MAHRRLWLFVAIAVVALLTAWMAVLGPLFGTRRIIGELPAPRFVRPGTLVLHAGMAIGRVRAMECHDSVAVVVLALEQSDLPLTRAHRVRRTTQGPFGDDPVELVAPTYSAPLLRSSDTLAGLAPTAPTRADSTLARQMPALGWQITNTTQAPCRLTTR
jgi:ABC-type transporter Mla subunit MlaD